MGSALYAAMSAAPTTKRARYELQRAALISERQGGGFDAHWRDLSDFLVPRRTRFWSGDRNKGDKRNQNIIDSTARFAARTAQSGLHAGLTSPARPWFNLTTPDPDLAEFGPVKEWLHIVTQRMRTVFTQSNLYNALPIVYGDMVVFGTAAMSAMPDDDDLFRSFAYPVGSYAMALNKRGVVNTFYREYELTVLATVEEFGVRTGYKDIDWNRLSTRVKNLFDRGQYYEPVTIGWLVQPNMDRRPNALLAKDRMKFTSCHFEIDQQGRDENIRADKFLRESGFESFPIFAPRWDITGEDAYGTDCPGMTALGDVRQLQIMARRKGQLLSKAVDPPLKGPNALRTTKTSLVAGDITYVDVREGMAGLSPIHEVRLEGFQHITADINDVRYLVRRAFYEDLFLMLASSDPSRGAQPVTAREVEERHEEKLLALGPVLERANDELLEPLIDRTYLMMEKAGLIPDPPDALDGVNLKVEFISILAQAQKLVGVSGEDRFMASLTPLVSVFPEVRHKLKAFRIVDNYADMLGVDPRQVRSDEDAQQLADAESQMQQSAQMAENIGKVGPGVAAAAADPIAQNSPLDRLLSGGGQAGAA